jgi:hypothetical protein
LDGAPFPFKIVLGIDVAVLPAAFAGVIDTTDKEKAIVKRIERWRRFTGDLQVLGM